MKGWVKIKIEELFDYTIPGEWGLEPIINNENVPVLRSTNFQNNGFIDYTNTVDRYVPSNYLAARTIKSGDILIEKSGGSPQQPAGRIVYCDKDFNGTCSNFIEIGKIKSNFDKRFVFYCLYFLYKSGRVLKYQQQTTGIINFKFNEYKAEEYIEIPSSKEEQYLISEVLRKVDDALLNLEVLINRKNRIKIGMMQDLLTKGVDKDGNIRTEQTHEFKDSPIGKIPIDWIVDSLENVTRSLITYGIVQAGPHIPNGIPYIRTGDMSGEFLTTKGLLRTSHEIAAKFNRSRVETNDIVFALRATIGKVLLVPEELNGANLTQGTARIAPDNNIVESEYLLWAMRTSYFEKQILEQKKGTTFFEITLAQLRSMLVAYPANIDEQKIIASNLKSISDNILMLVNRHNKLQKLKVGLMQDLLTGKVKVNELQIEEMGRI
ncbi:restriction endonuclease subunit S [Bacillus safensis]|uniref:restriction endonuclease subunit S n=1 Tax=Bacillus safensis TaxID=561879 RepID=UPI000B452C98|nr:restriction endonuclease subunit S [Bacillus safensis]PAK34769.1 restriction endonuclease subunit S [Bacillus safensis]UDB50097.1 restriction endonuclease subunit S [Bacillus safensis]